MVNFKTPFILIFTLTSCKMEEESSLPTSQEERRYVEAVHPLWGDLTEEIAFLGYVEPSKLISIHFSLEGKLLSCKAKIGQFIQEKDEICRLDASLVDLEWKRALNALESAKTLMETNLPEKQKLLFEAGLIGQSEFEQVRIQSENAKAQYQEAQSLLAMMDKKRKEHILYSPSSGTISQILLKAGQPVSPMIPAAMLSDQSSLQVKVLFHASHFDDIQVGLKGFIQRKSSSLLLEAVGVTVLEKGTFIDPLSQTFQAFLRIAPQEWIPLGMMVSGVLFLEKSSSLKIPQSALYSWNEKNEAQVYVIQEDRLMLKNIQTGKMSHLEVEVLKGLQEEDWVISSVGPDYREGLKVQRKF